LGGGEFLTYLEKKAQSLGFSLHKIDYEKLRQKELLEKKGQQETLKNQFIINLFEKSGFNEGFIESLNQIKLEFALNIKQNTFLTGSFGSGKTLGVLKAVYHALKESRFNDLKNHHFRYITCYNLFNLRYTNLSDYERLKSVPLLILDEFMTLKNYVREDFNPLMHDLIDSRILKKIPTVLISNIKFEVIKDLTKKGIIEPALFSRLQLFNKITHLGKDKREKEA
jgi:DNA replication protein DnaC